VTPDLYISLGSFLGTAVMIVGGIWKVSAVMSRLSTRLENTANKADVAVLQTQVARNGDDIRHLSVELHKHQLNHFERDDS